MLIFSRTAITIKARAVVGRGEEGPLYDPGSELILGGIAMITKWDKEKKGKLQKSSLKLRRSLSGIFFFSTLTAKIICYYYT